MVCSPRNKEDFFFLSSMLIHPMLITAHGASQFALEVNNSPVNAGNVRDMGLISGLGRFPGGRHGSNSSLENPMDRGAWQAIVHGIAKSQT